MSRARRAHWAFLVLALSLVLAAAPQLAGAAVFETISSYGQDPVVRTLPCTVTDVAKTSGHVLARCTDGDSWTDPHSVVRVAAGEWVEAPGFESYAEPVPWSISGDGSSAIGIRWCVPSLSCPPSFEAGLVVHDWQGTFDELTPPPGTTYLQPFPAIPQPAFISDDGAVRAGTGWVGADRIVWHDGGGVAFEDPLDHSPSTCKNPAATGLARGGNALAWWIGCNFDLPNLAYVVAGVSTADGQVLEATTLTEVRAFSDDLRVWVGVVGTALGEPGQAGREVDGVYESLGSLPSGGQTIANDVSANGNVIVGNSSRYQQGLGWTHIAFIWRPATGMQSLEALVAGLGGDTTGWKLQWAEAITADGRTIVGNGVNPDGQYEGFIIRLDEAPPPPPVPLGPLAPAALALALAAAGVLRARETRRSPATPGALRTRPMAGLDPDALHH